MRNDRRPWAAVLGWWLAGTATYVSFVSLVWTQIVAGAVVAATAVAVAARAWRVAELSYTASWPRVWRVGAVGRILAREVRAVVGALVRQARGVAPVAGRYVAVPTDEPVDSGVDAALTLEASLAPNTYVVASFTDEQLLLLHQFQPSPGARRSFPRWHP